MDINEMLKELPHNPGVVNQIKGEMIKQPMDKYCGCCTSCDCCDTCCTCSTDCGCCEDCKPCKC